MTTVKTIGTGGDYSTLQAWEDAAPATLTDIWEGQCFNQGFTGSTNLLTIAGSTSTSSFYKRLTTATGASWRDNSANAINYDTTKGAYISSSTGYGTAIMVSENYARIENLQVDGVSTGPPTVETSNDNILFRNCIIRGSNRAITLSRANIVANCLIIAGPTAFGFCVRTLSNATPNVLYNTTMIGGSSTLGHISSYLNPTLINCAIFGCAAGLDDGTHHGTGCSNNYTDVASPPTGFTQVAFDTTTGSGFNSTSNDFKIKSTSALKNAGTSAGSPYTDTDVFGTSRPQGASFDVGMHEYVAAGAAFIAGLPVQAKQAVNRAGTY